MQILESEFSEREPFYLYLLYAAIMRSLINSSTCLSSTGIPPNKYHYIDDLVVILPQNVWEYLYNR